ncbi:MAG: hypothetical protein AB7U30_02410 [Sulfuricellaceae bacterium]|jgi:hypothetical protein
MTTVSSILPAIPAATSSAAPASATAQPPATPTFGMVQDSVSLSTEAGVLAALGGSSSTYTATGLLNSMAAAGTLQGSPLSAGGQDPQTVAQDTTDQGVVGTLSADPSLAGVYNASGVLQALPTDVNSNWATVLQSTPSLTGVVTQDSLDQGIVATL